MIGCGRDGISRIRHPIFNPGKLLTYGKSSGLTAEAGPVKDWARPPLNRVSSCSLKRREGLDTLARDGCHGTHLSGLIAGGKGQLDTLRPC